ncbi:MFS transporter [Catenisphaera adipataccumulans]|uniref:UMF1 family MFS transporter n=1 Tax=Catenisphaera adipataccumulans TaxID=700500 RepID=A0A7W8FX17_9FIRM|nr:MFS transporter [Catenisphaera adipataccumulans]MBB5183220.1 UMF1 family MFS transporter [Catenisphaera adipataccumulans]
MNEPANAQKLTKKEKAWILYDVGNSAFTMMVSTIIPIYYNALAARAGISDADYLATWGYAISLATFVSAILGVLFGALSDQKGYKKIMFSLFLFIGAAGCTLLGFTTGWQIFLIVFVLTRIAYNDSLVCYDSMVTDITTDDRVDKVSAHGYAWGYIGSCIPFGVCLVLNLFYKNLGMTQTLAMRLSFLITAVWWVGMSVPLLRCYRQIHYAQSGSHPVKNSLIRLRDTLLQVREQKHIFIFLLAFFFYIDGVYTIIDMATAYGKALGLNTAGLLLALLVTQFVAFPCSILFGRLADKHPTGKLILVCITAYIGIAIFAIFLHSQIQFWILAIVVGMFQGGIQSMSRSYYAKLIPAEQSGEYFGLYDIFGKGASFMGTFLVSAMTQMTGSMNIGVGAITLIMFVGLILMLQSEKQNKALQKEKL